MKVGDVFRGITGNLMVVEEIDGTMCQLAYTDAYLRDEGPWWEIVTEVEDNLDLVHHNGGPT